MMVETVDLGHSVLFDKVFKGVQDEASNFARLLPQTNIYFGDRPLNLCIGSEAVCNNPRNQLSIRLNNDQACQNPSKPSGQNLDSCTARMGDGLVSGVYQLRTGGNISSSEAERVSCKALVAQSGPVLPSFT